MKIVKINEIIEQGEAIVHYDVETGLILSCTIENFFAYFAINGTDECEFVSSFPVEQFVCEEVCDRGETIIEILINGAKKLAKEVQKSKVPL